MRFGCEVHNVDSSISRDGSCFHLEHFCESILVLLDQSFSNILLLVKHIKLLLLKIALIQRFLYLSSRVASLCASFNLEQLRNIGLWFVLLRHYLIETVGRHSGSGQLAFVQIHFNFIVRFVFFGLDKDVGVEHRIVVVFELHHASLE